MPDNLYLALLDRHGTPEATAASMILAFNRDVGNGGLAQVVFNLHGNVAAILDALKQLGPRFEQPRIIVGEAAALYQSLVTKPDPAGNAWERYRATYQDADQQWNLLDKRYNVATNPVVPGDDLLEKAVLAFALAHPAAFTAAAEAAK